MSNEGTATPLIAHCSWLPWRVIPDVDEEVQGPDEVVGGIVDQEAALEILRLAGVAALIGGGVAERLLNDGVLPPDLAESTLRLEDVRAWTRDEIAAGIALDPGVLIGGELHAGIAEDIDLPGALQIVHVPGLERLDGEDI